MTAAVGAISSEASLPTPCPADDLIFRDFARQRCSPRGAATAPVEKADASAKPPLPVPNTDRTSLSLLADSLSLPSCNTTRVHPHPPTNTEPGEMNWSDSSKELREITQEKNARYSPNILPPNLRFCTLFASPLSLEIKLAIKEEEPTKNQARLLREGKLEFLVR